MVSQAQRDDDDEWAGTWSSEDATGGKHDEQVRNEMTAHHPDPKPAVEPPEEPDPDGSSPRLEEAPATADTGGWQIEPSPIRKTPKPPPEQPPTKPTEPEKPKTKQEVTAKPARSGARSDLLVDVGGGIIVLPRMRKVQPAVGLGLGWNLGRHLGWPGLYLAANVNTFIGESIWGAQYVLLDSGLGFKGRFGLGPVNLSIGLEFGLRRMFITKESSTESPNRQPELGFGVCSGLTLDVPLSDLLFLQISVDECYMKEPLSTNFEFSTVISGGPGLAF